MTLVNQFYDVKEGDNFVPSSYTEVEKELMLIRRGIDHTHSMFKGEIVVSYFKDHCLKSAWIKDYPELTELITSRLFKSTHLELLFESCRNKSVFRLSLEDHIRNIFSHGTERPADTGTTKHT
jgi:hypothetical protein